MRPPCSGIAHDHNICIRIQIPTRFSQTHAAHHVGRADRDSFRGPHACRPPSGRPFVEATALRRVAIRAAVERAHRLGARPRGVGRLRAARRARGSAGRSPGRPRPARAYRARSRARPSTRCAVRACGRFAMHSTRPRTAAPTSPPRAAWLARRTGRIARSACAAAIARDTRRSTITSRPTGSRTPASAARRWANSANAARHGFTHAAQDAYATGSLQWAQHAQLAIELT